MAENAIFFVTILLALAYAYSNGVNDAANAIATVVSTRVLTPMAAIIMGASLNLLGALSGTAVAKTIGKGLVEPAFINEYTVMAAIGASVIWVLSATRLGFPVSVSHSLVASVVGAGLAAAGSEAIIVEGFTKVLIALAVSPLIGFGASYTVMLGLYWLLHKTSPHAVRTTFSKLHILAGAFMAYSHGKNDGQNAMGIIALATFVHFGRTELTIDLWMILVSALGIAAGTALGGWRVIRTLGMRITKLEDVHGFAASATAASIIAVASEIGLPVSTTHTISSAIMGAGATRRLSAVRWGVTRSIGLAWLVTYPVCFGLAWTISTFFEFTVR
ncbi:MAG: inorganic phosphate transporter [Chloroflexi bacterium]|nr:inorganic phosphate transporter [Chloroflexota bacterium]